MSPPPPPPAKDKPSPARSSSVSNTTKPLPSKPPAPKFELLAFQPISFSLTEGTDIPPPPVIEEPPPPPVPGKGNGDRAGGDVNGVQGGKGVEGGRAEGQGAVNGDSTINPSNSARDRTSELSNHNRRPEENKRTNSIRRFMSRKALNTVFVAGGAGQGANGQGANGINGHASARDDSGLRGKVEDPHLRPDSQATFFKGRTGLGRALSTAGSRGEGKEKWYRRFSTGAGWKRSGSGGFDDGDVNSGKDVRSGEGAGVNDLGAGVGQGALRTGSRDGMKDDQGTVKRKPVNTGPPAPRLPELSVLREDEGMGAEEMFKNVK